MSNSSDRHFKGLFIASDSFLHRLDPRSKLVVFPLLIMTGFMVGEWLLLLIFALILIIWLPGCRGLAGRYVRMLFGLRYLLLFTLLVHLLFTPGFTLWGVSWLSRDGLYQGLLVCLQLSLALGFSLLLAGTTSTVAVAYGIERLLKPLKRVGVPVHLIGDSLAMVLYFLERLAASLFGGVAAGTNRKTVRSRIEQTFAKLAALFEEYLESAESMAARVAAGEQPLHREQLADHTFGFTGKDIFFLTLHVSICIATWTMA